MKHSSYQDSSVIRSRFVYSVWVEEIVATGFNKSKKMSCKLLQQSTGKVSDHTLTCSLSGAASKVSLCNYYSFCFILVSFKSGVIISCHDELVANGNRKVLFIENTQFSNCR